MENLRQKIYLVLTVLVVQRFFQMPLRFCL